MNAWFKLSRETTNGKKFISFSLKTLILIQLLQLPNVIFLMFLKIIDGFTNIISTS